MHGNNYSFDFYSYSSSQKGNKRIAEIHCISKTATYAKRVLLRSFDEYSELLKWTEDFTKEMNVKSIREFLNKKPHVFMDCFELSLDGFVLTAANVKLIGSLKKFIINDVDRVKEFEKLSQYRIGCVLSILSKWGILWEFQRGKYANVIRGL